MNDVTDIPGLCLKENSVVHESEIKLEKKVKFDKG